MDVIEIRFWDRPVFLRRVVDEEMHVCGHGDGLDGGEVRGLDFGVGELVAELDGPLAGAGAGVEDVFGGGEGGEIVFLGEGGFEDFVLVVEAVGFGGVVGEVVGWERGLEM